MLAILAGFLGVYLLLGSEESLKSWVIYDERLEKDHYDDNHEDDGQ